MLQRQSESLEEYADRIIDQCTGWHAACFGEVKAVVKLLMTNTTQQC
jgi:hypothetical protein